MWSLSQIWAIMGLLVTMEIGNNNLLEIKRGGMGFSWGSRVFLLRSYWWVVRMLIWRQGFCVINKYLFLCLEWARHCSWPGIPPPPHCYFRDKHAMSQMWALGLSLSQVQTVAHELSTLNENLHLLPLCSFSKLQLLHTLWPFLTHWHIGVQRIILYTSSILYFSFSVSQVHKIFF